MRTVDEKRQRLVDALDEEMVRRIDDVLIPSLSWSDQHTREFLEQSVGRKLTEQHVRPEDEVNFALGIGEALAIVRVAKEWFENENLTCQDLALMSEYLAAVAEETQEENLSKRLTTLADYSASYARGLAKFGGRWDLYLRALRRP
jgi:hypothetical protein